MEMRSASMWGSESSSFLFMCGAQRHYLEVKKIAYYPFNHHSREEHVIHVMQ